MTASAPAVQRANGILAGDRILVNLPANSKSRKQTVSEMFDSAGFRINGLGARIDATSALDLSKVGAAANGAPTFPMDKYTAALKATGNANSPEVSAVNTEYLLDFADWKAGRPQDQTDLTIGTSIAAAVLSWVSTTYGIKIGTAGQREEEVIDPKGVAVNVPNRTQGQPVVFTLTLAPVWGTR